MRDNACSIVKGRKCNIAIADNSSLYYSIQPSVILIKSQKEIAPRLHTRPNHAVSICGGGGTRWKNSQPGVQPQTLQPFRPWGHPAEQQAKVGCLGSPHRASLFSLLPQNRSAPGMVFGLPSPFVTATHCRSGEARSRFPRVASHRLIR